MMGKSPAEGRPGYRCICMMADTGIIALRWAMIQSEPEMMSSWGTARDSANGPQASLNPRSEHYVSCWLDGRKFRAAS